GGLARPAGGGAPRRPPGLPAGHPLVRRRLRLLPHLQPGGHGRGPALPGGARGGAGDRGGNRARRNRPSPRLVAPRDPWQGLSAGVGGADRPGYGPAPRALLLPRPPAPPLPGVRPAPPAFLSGLISCCFLIARERATEAIQGSGAVSPGSPRRCAARDDEGTGDDRQGGRRSGTWRPFCGARSWPAFPSLLMNMAPKRGLLAPSSKGLHRRHCERPKGEKQSRAFRLWPWIASSAVPPRDDDGDKGLSGRSFPADGARSTE